MSDKYNDQRIASLERIVQQLQYEVRQLQQLAIQVKQQVTQVFGK